MAILSAVISAAFRIYSLLILIRVLLTWLNPDPYRSFMGRVGAAAPHRTPHRRDH